MIRMIVIGTAALCTMCVAPTLAAAQTTKGGGVSTMPGNHGTPGQHFTRRGRHAKRHDAWQRDARKPVNAQPVNAQPVNARNPNQRINGAVRPRHGHQDVPALHRATAGQLHQHAPPTPTASLIHLSSGLLASQGAAPQAGFFAAVLICTIGQMAKNCEYLHGVKPV